MTAKEKSDEYEIWMEIWLRLENLDNNSDFIGKLDHFLKIWKSTAQKADAKIQQILP